MHAPERSTLLQWNLSDQLSCAHRTSAVNPTTGIIGGLIECAGLSSDQLANGVLCTRRSPCHAVNMHASFCDRVNSRKVAMCGVCTEYMSSCSQSHHHPPSECAQTDPAFGEHAHANFESITAAIR